MKAYAKSYGVFLVMLAVTALVVRPIVAKANSPMLTSALGG